LKWMEKGWGHLLDDRPKAKLIKVKYRQYNHPKYLDMVLSLLGNGWGLALV
jgi:hypothetical protein